MSGFQKATHKNHSHARVRDSRLQKLGRSRKQEQAGQRRSQAGTHTPAWTAPPCLWPWPMAMGLNSRIVHFSQVTRNADFKEKSELFLKILLIYFYRKGKGERKRRRETLMCGCLSHAPNWGPDLQPRQVP